MVRFTRDVYFGALILLLTAAADLLVHGGVLRMRGETARPAYELCE